MPKPLDREILSAQRRRDRLAALTAAETRKLEALQRVQAELIEAVVEEQRALRVHSSSVNTRSEQMQIENRIAISKGRSEGSTDPFMAAIRAVKPRGYTLRSLAKRVGTPASLLSMQRKGDRPIPRARAEEIAKLTGWPADAKHWPGGLS